LIIFKAYLDIGYTALAKDVYDRYLCQFVPNVICVEYELKDTDTPFVWTVGSWLIHEALKQDTDGVPAQAIEDGVIAWHGLPFTSHTELMTPALFRYGLSLSKTLDEQLGVTPIVQTDFRRRFGSNSKVKKRLGKCQSLVSGSTRTM